MLTDTLYAPGEAATSACQVSDAILVIARARQFEKSPETSTVRAPGTTIVIRQVPAASLVIENRECTCIEPFDAVVELVRDFIRSLRPGNRISAPTAKKLSPGKPISGRAERLPP